AQHQVVAARWRARFFLNVRARRSNEDPAFAITRTILRPTVQAAVTLKEYGKSYGDLDISGLIDALTEQTTLANDGDLGRGEAMLTTQAHTLDAIFNNLAQRAINSEYMENLDRYLKLALRAQSQCRATWETLSAMKNPPMVGYVRQANISHGHQQVNNAPSPASDTSHTRENANLQNKLLEENDGERLDFGAAGTAGQANPAMAPLGKGDRTKDAEG
ncbi:MAG: hypothetical protein O3C34_16230, partial [Proteobacteria bacterium]|nr:hypothetical protein [Pseudomonadota bacterium]